MNRIIAVLLVVVSSLNVLAQDQEEPFERSFKPVVKVFADWHQGVGDEEYQNESRFQINRAVLGFDYFLSPNISSRVILDTDAPGVEKNFIELAYLRNAYIAYKNDKVDVLFGVIGTKQFKTQENNWGYRYIHKSAMDHYKFSPSVDFGTYVKYRFTPWLSADFTLTNGEGAKIQQDSEGKYRTGYGTELSFLKNFTIRAFYDYHYAPTGSDDQEAISFFLGYKSNTFRIGAEYNALQNFKFATGDDREIFSIYSSLSFTKQLQMFVRYDNHMAEQSSLRDDVSEELYMAGFDYSVVKGLKISPNFRYGDFRFKGPGQGRDEPGGIFFLNFEYKF